MCVSACLVALAVGCGGAPFTMVDPTSTGDGAESLPSGYDAGRLADQLAVPDTGADHAASWGADAAPDGGSDATDPPIDGGGAVDAPVADPVDARADAPGVDAMDAGDAPVSVDAAAESGADCVNDLSDVGAGDFHIDFDVLATAVESDGPLVEQRATCGQYDTHWLVAIASGHLVVQTYDGNAGATLESVGAVNDAAPHRVVAARVAGTLSISIDGQIDTSEPNAVFAPGALPLMQVGRSACASAYSGQVTSACVTRP